MKALLLCAGLGTRFRPLSDAYPKPAFPFLDIPMMCYSLFYLEKLGLTDLVVNLHHKPQLIQAAIKEFSPHPKFKLSYSDETDKPLGSGGAVWKAREFLKGPEPFIYANGDEFMLFDHDRGYEPLWRAHHQNFRPIATLLVTQHPGVGTEFGGIWVNSSGYVVDIGKKTSYKDVIGYHFTGVIVFDQKIYQYLPAGESNIFLDAVKKAIAMGEKVYVHIEENMTWYETGDPSGYLEATGQAIQYLKKGLDSNQKSNGLRAILSYFRPNLMKRSDHIWAGKNFKDQLVDASEGILIAGDDVDIRAPIKVKGFAVLGDRVRIEQATTLDRVVVTRDCRVTSSYLTGVLF